MSTLLTGTTDNRLDTAYRGAWYSYPCTRQCLTQHSRDGQRSNLGLQYRKGNGQAGSCSIQFPREGLTDKRLLGERGRWEGAGFVCVLCRKQRALMLCAVQEVVKSL